LSFDLNFYETNSGKVIKQAFEGMSILK